MSGAPSTSSLEVLKDLCVQGAFLRENVNHRHTNIHHKAQVRHMHSHSSTVGAHQHLNAPAKKCQHACEIISQTHPKNQPSLSPCPPCHHRLPFWQSRPFLASCILIPALHISDAATQLRESRFINNLWLDWKENLMIDLGKPQRKFISVHLGIAQIAIGPPPRCQTGTLWHLFSGKIMQMPVCTKTFLLKIGATNHPGKGLDPPTQTGNAQMNCYIFMVGLP